MKLYGNNPEGGVDAYLKYRAVLLKTLAQLKQQYVSSEDTDILHARKKAIAEVAAIVGYIDMHFPIFEGFTIQTPSEHYTKETFQAYISSGGLVYGGVRSYVGQFFLLEEKLYRLGDDEILEEIRIPADFIERYRILQKHTLNTNYNNLHAEVISSSDWLKLVACDLNSHDTYLTEVLRVARTGPVFGERLSGSTIDPIYFDLLNLYARLNIALKFSCQDNTDILVEQENAHFFLGSNNPQCRQELRYDLKLHKENMRCIHKMAKRYTGSENAWLRQLGKGLLYATGVLLIAAGIVAAIPSGGLSLAAIIAGVAVVAGVSGVGMYKTKYRDLAKLIDEVELPHLLKPKN